MDSRWSTATNGPPVAGVTTSSKPLRIETGASNALTTSGDGVSGVGAGTFTLLSGFGISDGLFAGTLLTSVGCVAIGVGTGTVGAVCVVAFAFGSIGVASGPLAIGRGGARETGLVVAGFEASIVCLSAQVRPGPNGLAG